MSLKSVELFFKPMLLNNSVIIFSVIVIASLYFATVFQYFSTFLSKTLHITLKLVKMSLKAVYLFFKTMLLNNSVIISSTTVITFFYSAKEFLTFLNKTLQSYTVISKIVW